MNRLTKTALTLAAALAIGLPAAAAAQGGALTVDEALAGRGKTVWMKNGCAGCHGFGKRMAGPDLAGVQERRSLDWLRRWLKDTRKMLEADSIAQALLAESQGVKMPQFKLTDPDVDALVHYMARASGKRAK